MENEELEFKYQPKQFQKETFLSALCADYEPKGEHGDNCQKAGLCKNATYGMDNRDFGSCFGGTRQDEIEQRERIADLRKWGIS